MRYRIEVVGAGVVGTATGAALTAWGHDVVYTEIRTERREELREEDKEVVAPEEAVTADLSVVAVPTPYDEAEDGLDTSHVEAAVERIADADASRVVVLRSTVPPGTTELLGATYGLDHIAVVPEFLFAKTAVEDAKSVERVVVGTESEHARERVESAFAHNDPSSSPSRRRRRNSSSSPPTRTARPRSPLPTNCGGSPARSASTATACSRRSGASRLGSGTHAG